jgi:hypothetical protein
MEPLSKAELGSVLRDQITARNAQRAADKVQVRADDVSASPRGAYAAIVPLGDTGPKKGRRHVGQVEPPSKQAYAVLVRELLAEAEAKRMAAPSPDYPLRTLLPRDDERDDEPVGDTGDALEQLLGNRAVNAVRNIYA